MHTSQAAACDVCEEAYATLGLFGSTLLPAGSEEAGGTEEAATEDVGTEEEAGIDEAAAEEAEEGGKQ